MASPDIQSKKEQLETEIEFTTRTEELIRTFRSDYLGLIGFGLLFVIIISIIFGPEISPYGGVEPTYDSVTGPSAEHPLGTDHLGRDILTRILVGGRYSLTIGVSSIALATILGTTFGSIAGYTKKEYIDEIIMRFMDILLSFPAILLGIAILGMIDPEMLSVGSFTVPDIALLIFVVGLVYTPRFARVVRGTVLSERNKEYVLLARLEGQSDYSIMTKEIFINILSPLLVLISYRIGSAMIIAAGLTFLGFGLSPPTPGWGVMIVEGRDFILLGHWWMVAFPSIALGLTIMSFNLVGDTLRDALDPNVSVLND